MPRKIILACCWFGIAATAWADPFYCTETNQYINEGMTAPDVEQACGAPQSIQKSEKAAVQRVPVQQLTFNVSTSTSGSIAGTIEPGIQASAVAIGTSTPATVIVTVKNNQINQILLNGQSVESVSLCEGGSFGVGDSASVAIDNCGNPSFENDTYENVPTGEQDKIETWSYQPTNYQPPFQLVFTNDVLTQIIHS